MVELHFARYKGAGFDFAFFLVSLASTETVHPASVTVQLSVSTIPCKILNKVIPACYPYHMILAQYSRRPLDSFPGLNPNPSYLLPISHGINLFADPHPLNPVPSIFYKNMGGLFPTFDYHLFPITYPLSAQPLAHSFVLFCIYQKLNLFVFNRLRTLCEKHPGAGEGRRAPVIREPRTHLKHAFV